MVYTKFWKWLVNKYYEQNGQVICWDKQYIWILAVSLGGPVKVYFLGNLLLNMTTEHKKQIYGIIKTEVYLSLVLLLGT